MYGEKALGLLKQQGSKGVIGALIPAILLVQVGAIDGSLEFPAPGADDWNMGDVKFENVSVVPQAHTALEHLARDGHEMKAQVRFG